MNKYEFLKIDDGRPDADTVIPQGNSWRVTTGNVETVIITTATMPNGLWIYGYQVYWHTGKKSILSPTSEHGRFKTERDAKLYAIGFMLAYSDYFIVQTVYDLTVAEYNLAQLQLF